MAPFHTSREATNHLQRACNEDLWKQWAVKLNCLVTSLELVGIWICLFVFSAVALKCLLWRLIIAQMGIKVCSLTYSQVFSPPAATLNGRYVHSHMWCDLSKNESGGSWFLISAVRSDFKCNRSSSVTILDFQGCENPVLWQEVGPVQFHLTCRSRICCLLLFSLWLREAPPQRSGGGSESRFITGCRLMFMHKSEKQRNWEQEISRMFRSDHKLDGTDGLRIYFNISDLLCQPQRRQNPPLKMCSRETRLTFVRSRCSASIG